MGDKTIKHQLKHTNADLKQRQSLPFEQKVRLTKRRIREWYDYYDGKVCVSFSGGKDSTVLLHLVRSMYPEVPAVFSDTGLEYPEIRQFVRSFDNVIWLKPEKDFKTIVLTLGYPVISKEVSNKIDLKQRGYDAVNKYFDGTATNLKGEQSRYVVPKKWHYLVDAPFRISAKCCNEMKKKPIKKWQKKMGLHPYLGTMAHESKLREVAWLEHGCNAFDSTDPKSTPMSFWLENDVLRYIKENNLPYASIYGDIVEYDRQLDIFGETHSKFKTTGVSRTGCIFCCYGVHLEEHPNRFERLKESHPQLYNYCMKPVEDGGLGLDEVLNYCNIPH